MSLIKELRKIMTQFKDEIETKIAAIAAGHAGNVDPEVLKQQIAHFINLQLTPIQASLDDLSTKVAAIDGVDDETKASVAELQGVVSDLTDALEASQSPSPNPAPAPSPSPDPAPAPAPAPTPQPDPNAAA